MSRYFTSDWHLGSDLIIKYANRPYANQHVAAAVLCNSCNDMTCAHDVVFHVGDFWLEGHDRHGKKDDVNKLDSSMNEVLAKMNARFVLLDGNHDTGHNCEADLKNMRIDLNQNYRNVYVNHFPSDHHDYKGPGRIPKGMPFINLCGHVHDKWLLKYDRENHVLNINVGVDVWDYKPVRDSEITELLDFVLKFDIFDRTWAWNRRDLNMYIEAWKHQLELGRTARKNERYAKKGLTPEECERRKIEAMKAKGLI